MGTTSAGSSSQVLQSCVDSERCVFSNDEDGQDTGYRTLPVAESLTSHEEAAKLLLCTSMNGQEVCDETDALPSRLHYSNFDLFCTVVSMLTYLFDLVLDCAVAFYFYHLAVQYGIYHYWYFGLTLAFVILPSLTMTGFSLRWYLMDADNSCLPEVPMWRWVVRILALMFQMAPILRYVDSISYGLMSRKAGKKEQACSGDPIAEQCAKEKRIKYFTLMVYEDADATLLRLFECFMESAPQLVLQIYILIKDPQASKMNDSQIIAGDEVADYFIKSTILLLSVISSLVSLAWSLVVYHRSLRYTYPEKNNLDWRGNLSQFAWHFSSITARVIALSLFASIHPSGIGLVCASHWLIMSTWVILQRTEACNTRCEEIMFSGVLGAIYIFSFFNAKEERTRYKYLIYYGFCFCENTALILVWAVQTHDGLPDDYVRWYFYPGLIGHYVSFFAGLFFMVIYYYCFHPSDIKKVKVSLRRRRKRHKPFVARSKSTRFMTGIRRISNFGFNSKRGKEVHNESGKGTEMASTKRPCQLRSEMSEPSKEDLKLGKISPSVSSPILDVPLSPTRSARAEQLLRSSSMPTRSSSLPHYHQSRSLKMLGNRRLTKYPDGESKL